MKKEKILPVLDGGLINKLESIDFEIKCLLNINSKFSQLLDDESVNNFKFMDENELNELNDIRHRIKRLCQIFKNKLNMEHEKMNYSKTSNSDGAVSCSSIKPPLGLIPKKFHDERIKEERFNEVCGAIARYYDAGLKINIEWIEEYNELVECIGKHYINRYKRNEEFILMEIK